MWLVPGGLWLKRLWQWHLEPRPSKATTLACTYDRQPDRDVARRDCLYEESLCVAQEAYLALQAVRRISDSLDRFQGRRVTARTAAHCGRLYEHARDRTAYFELCKSFSLILAAEAGGSRLLTLAEADAILSRHAEGKDNAAR